MDIPNMSNITDDVKKAANTEMGKQVLGKVAAAAHNELRDIEKIADAKGLGGAFDFIENIVESKTGMDLDGDGDTGK